MSLWMATSRCSSPMPLMMSWLVSGSTLVRRVGSSRTSRPRASASLVSSTFLAGVIDCAITGSGKRILDVGLALFLFLRFGHGAVYRRAIQGRRQIVGHGIEQQANAVILLGGAAQDRRDFAGQGAVADGVAEHVFGNRLALDDAF